MDFYDSYGESLYPVGVGYLDAEYAAPPMRGVGNVLENLEEQLSKIPAKKKVVSYTTESSSYQVSQANMETNRFVQRVMELNSLVDKWSNEGKTTQEMYKTVLALGDVDLVKCFKENYDFGNPELEQNTAIVPTPTKLKEGLVEPIPSMQANIMEEAKKLLDANVSSHMRTPPPSFELGWEPDLMNELVVEDKSYASHECDHDIYNERTLPTVPVKPPEIKPNMAEEIALRNVLASILINYEKPAIMVDSLGDLWLAANCILAGIGTQNYALGKIGLLTNGFTPDWSSKIFNEIFYDVPWAYPPPGVDVLIVMPGVRLKPQSLPCRHAYWLRRRGDLISPVTMFYQADSDALVRTDTWSYVGPPLVKDDLIFQRPHAHLTDSFGITGIDDPAFDHNYFVFELATHYATPTFSECQEVAKLDKKYSKYFEPGESPYWTIADSALKRGTTMFVATDDYVQNALLVIHEELFFFRNKRGDWFRIDFNMATTPPIGWGIFSVCETPTALVLLDICGPTDGGSRLSTVMRVAAHLRWQHRSYELNHWNSSYQYIYTIPHFPTSPGFGAILATNPSVSLGARQFDEFLAFEKQMPLSGGFLDAFIHCTKYRYDYEVDEPILLNRATLEITPADTSFDPPNRNLDLYKPQLGMRPNDLTETWINRVIRYSLTKTRPANKLLGLIWEAAMAGDQVSMRAALIVAYEVLVRINGPALRMYDADFRLKAAEEASRAWVVRDRQIRLQYALD